MTCLVWSSVHLTSSVSSTEQSGQNSSHVQSFGGKKRRGEKELRVTSWTHTCMQVWDLEFPKVLIFCQRTGLHYCVLIRVRDRKIRQILSSFILFFRRLKNKINIKKTSHIGIFIFKSKKVFINLFHNSGLLIYSFICMIISFLTLLAHAKKIQKNCYFKRGQN